MNLLIVEYINGGGLINQDLPPSLATEGRLMLQALLNELKSIANLSVLMPLDRRCQGLDLPDHCRIHWLDQGQNLTDIVARLLGECDAFLPIAPETDRILAQLAELAAGAGKPLLLSDANTIDLCGDKLATSQHLTSNGIPAITTLALSERPTSNDFPCVLKPRDGVGCDGQLIIADQDRYRQALSQLPHSNQHVRQPLLAGAAVSLSVLCKSGHGWLLSCNRQLIDVEDGGFRLSGCLVNVDNPLRSFYQSLIDQVSQALPGLWGYIGIDLIETAEQGPLILEINPRLTTSYTAICSATGINVAAQMLRMLNDNPELSATRSQTVRIHLD